MTSRLLDPTSPPDGMTSSFLLRISLSCGSDQLHCTISHHAHSLPLKKFVNQNLRSLLSILGLPRNKFFSILFFLGYPSAVGQVHITSGEDVHAPVDFDPGYLRT